MSSEEDFSMTDPAWAFAGRHGGHMSTNEEHINLSMNAKLPPSFDGRVSWSRYEDLVRDWVTFTQADAHRQGLLLKNRLTHNALICRELLDNNRLVDPDSGVEYLLTTLRG